MLKKYLINKLYNNNDISIHLVETENHFVIEQNTCGLKQEVKIKNRENALLVFNERSLVIERIIGSTKFNSK